MLVVGVYLSYGSTIVPLPEKLSAVVGFFRMADLAAVFERLLDIGLFVVQYVELGSARHLGVISLLRIMNQG